MGRASALLLPLLALIPGAPADTIISNTGDDVAPPEFHEDRTGVDWTYRPVRDEPLPALIHIIPCCMTTMEPSAGPGGPAAGGGSAPPQRSPMHGGPSPPARSTPLTPRAPALNCRTTT
jgi:hypothetical protein